MSSQSQLILSPVQEFYKEKSILITGASGFVGKFIVEKLLRTCGSLDRIYILLRPKKGHSIDQRFDKLISCPIFNKLYLTDPKFHEKITPINGDISLPGLGISEKDRGRLQENVHIVIHSAATIKFNEPLPLAIQTNVQGVQKIVELCKEMTNLSALVHISTAYTNAERSFIEEKVYPFIGNSYLDLVVQDIQNMDCKKENSSLAKHESTILGKKPNTYVYSKALAECYLEQNKNALPIAIVRPSIVTAAALEPIEGFVDNMTAFSGMMVLIGQGHLQALPVTKNSVYDLIPVDYLANLVILAAWKKATDNESKILKQPETTALTVYNGCCQNPISFKQWKKEFLPALCNNPFQNAVSNPKVHEIENVWLFSAYTIIIQRMRAFLIDLAMNQRKSSLNMMTIHKHAQAQLGVLEFFVKRGYIFDRTNVHKLNAELSHTDRRLFPLFVQDINWPIYFKNYVAGLKKYTLKEKGNLILASPKAVTKQSPGLVGLWRTLSSIRMLRR